MKTINASTYVSTSSAHEAAVQVGFMEKTAQRLDDYQSDHADAIYLVGNNPQPGYRWNRPFLVCEQVAKTNSTGHGYSIRTAHAVREATREEFSRNINRRIYSVWSINPATAVIEIPECIEYADANGYSDVSKILRAFFVESRIKTAA
ncbi:MAG: hypothetical protein DIZ78_09330 [endosymbiont of Escarpia spicata]|uniref:Uncharacterized protein n=1 Tax=endosymbiont of Escarpia spicata TaxID=2200908 RepID=A0A370DN76_9GAMM|nr:MAG: hypothetical protein DIZ78_09330 [endosymbiont of Escarpia spicata]